MEITGVKVKYLSEKNEYGKNHMFELLDAKPLNELIEMNEKDKGIKIPIWKYNDKCYLKINDKKVDEYSINTYNQKQTNGIELFVFKNNIPYIIDVTFKDYNFTKDNETIKGYTISEINKIY